MNGHQRDAHGGEDSHLTAAEIDRVIREADDEEAATEALVDQHLYPLYRQGGLQAIQDVIEEHRSPRVASALEILCARVGISPRTLFDEDELVDEAARYLRSPRTGPASAAWAYQALWRPDLSADDRFDLILKLIERVGDDDDALWMIGDGPIGELQMQDGGVERLEAAARQNRRLRRALDLVQEIP